jgi:hypothetical protein
MLTVDPSQKKVVWLLMAILIGAICVTAVRLKPAAVQTPAALVTSSSRTASHARTVEVQVQNLSRNPFSAPADFARAQARSNAVELGLPTPPLPGEQPNNSGKNAKALGTLPAVQPMVVKMPNAKDPQGHDINSQPAPAYALLATIKSAGGLSAVIRSNGSIVQVVNVGDTLEGGYKVRALKPERAVLSNGEDTIVVNKPQS